MRRALRAALAAAAILLLASRAVYAQGEGEDEGDGGSGGGIFDDDMFEAGLAGDFLEGNPLGLVAAQPQDGGEEMPTANVVFTKKGREDWWSWTVSASGALNLGKTTLHNLQDPAWPEVLTLFETASLAEVMGGSISAADVDALLQKLTPGDGSAGYSSILDAVNAGALGVVARMPADANQAIGGMFIVPDDRMYMTGPPDGMGPGDGSGAGGPKPKPMCKCVATGAPVCGRNGKVYPNPDCAKCNQEKIRFACKGRFDCAGDCAVAARPGKHCGCGAGLKPVCSRKGKLYTNACLAKCAKARVRWPCGRLGNTRCARMCKTAAKGGRVVIVGPLA